MPIIQPLPQKDLNWWTRRKYPSVVAINYGLELMKILREDKSIDRCETISKSLGQEREECEEREYREYKEKEKKARERRNRELKEAEEKIKNQKK
jgi:hypothetical protein